VRALQHTVAFAGVLIVLVNVGAARPIASTLMIAHARLLIQFKGIIASSITAGMLTLAGLEVCKVGELALLGARMHTGAVFLVQPLTSWAFPVAVARAFLPVGRLFIRAVEVLWRALRVDHLTLAEVEVGLVTPRTGLQKASVRLHTGARVVVNNLVQEFWTVDVANTRFLAASTSLIIVPGAGWT